jgi:hypothetical protein
MFTDISAFKGSGFCYILQPPKRRRKASESLKSAVTKRKLNQRFGFGLV